MKNVISTILTVIVVFAFIVLGIVFSPFSLTQLQSETMIILLIICGASALYCFLVGEITRNNSQMDKLWSILPIIYLWVITVKGSFSPRLIIMAGLVTFWGVRLTINFGKKDAYSWKFWEGEEDYRWTVVRSSKPLNNKILWAIFDLLFISVYQNFLVLLICLPALAVMEEGTGFNGFDLIPAALTLGFILLETIADAQQMKFYDKRKELMKDGKKLEEIDAPYNKGFNTTGIWKYSRHPNYFSEQAIWICLYFFTISAGMTTYFAFHWSIVGCCLLVLLFLGSSTLGENISKSKYPLYEQYQKTTSKYLPLPNHN